MAAAQEPLASAQTETDRQVQTELIENILRAEPIDATWARAAELALEETFLDGNVEQLAVADAACSSTLCRVRVVIDDFASPQDGMSALTQAIATLPWAGESWLTFGQANANEAVLYLAREGYPLPQ